MPLSIGILLFPRMTQLDATGPYEVFSRVPGAAVHLVAEHAGPVRTEHGLTVIAEHDFASAPHLDVLCVPGGPGVDDALERGPLLDFVQERGAAARWVTSVCTGSLILGAAGLLRGRRATTHWLSLDLLARCGATAVEARVVRDGPVITGGGVTAGIDFALEVAAEIAGRDAAERIQLIIEYAPDPPLDAGTPRRARPEITASLRAGRSELHARRAERIDRAFAQR
jgi:cyclohexyl-isocyanide hydratase